MEETLERALTQVFGGTTRAAVSSKTEAGATAAAAGDGSLKVLASRAYDHYARAQELLRQGNFAGYGEEVKRLESVLKELRARAGR